MVTGNTNVGNLKDFINESKGFIIGVLEEYNFETNEAKLLAYDFSDNPQGHKSLIVQNMDKETDWIRQYLLHAHEREAQGLFTEELIVIVRNYMQDVVPAYKDMGNLAALESLEYGDIFTHNDLPGYRIRTIELPVVEVITELETTDELRMMGMREYLVSSVLHHTNPMVSSNQEASVVRIKVRVRVSNDVDLVAGVHTSHVFSTMNVGQGLSYIQITG